MKKLKNQTGNFRFLKNLLLKVNLTLTIFLVCLAQAAASAYSQKTRMDINIQNGNIVELITQIESKSEFFFYYQNSELSELNNITVKAKNTTVMEILDEVIKGTHFDYTINDRNIIMLRKTDAIIGNNIPVTALNNVAVQQRTISGKVTNANSQPLPGVTVIAKGSTQGAITDINGNYSLSNIPENAILVFSFVGMRTQEVEVGNRTVIDVILIEEAIDIDEVLVVGYGTRSKALNTSSISSINNEDLNIKSSVKNSGELLQGKITGVMVRNIGGAPGADPIIRIRGMNSIQGGNSALIVIDGFQRGSLSNLNPDDIESIDILKGANATAIYGSEGANGVIIVNTKQGKLNAQPSISFSTDFTGSVINKKLPLIKAGDWARYINAIEMGDNLYRDPSLIFTDAEIAEYDRTGGYDWQDIILRKAMASNYNLSVEGGLGNTNYRISGSFTDKDGIIKNSNYKRYTARIRVNTKIKEWLTAGIDIDKSNQIYRGPRTDTQTDNPISNALNVPPVFPPYNESGEYFSYKDILETNWVRFGPSIATGNPLATINESDILTKIYRNNLFGYLTFLPLPDLSFKIEAGIREGNPIERTFMNNHTFEGNSRNGWGILEQDLSSFFQNSNILNYTKTLNKHKIDLTGVFEQKSSEYYSVYIENQDFALQSLGYNSLGGGDIQNASSSASRVRILSYVGRFSYNYDNRYLFNSSVRRDGSSVFGKKNKWSVFPSMSLGWKLSEEEFIKDIAFIDNLMIRASYGLTGNQAISPYRSLANVGVSGRYPYEGGESTQIGYMLSRSENPNLKWETTKQFDIGLDIAILNRTLELSADYYYKKTFNLLQDREIPYYTGFSTVLDNLGKISNEGFEFSANYFFNSTNFTMSHKFNFSTNKTLVLDLGGLDRLGYSAGGSGNEVNDPLIYLFEGQRWGQIYAWGYEGTWRLDEEEEAKKYGQLPGGPKYTDLNGDYIIDSQDRYVVGNVLPKFEYGWNSRFTYKNFFSSFQIQGVYGNKIFNVTRAGTFWEERWTDRWTPENQNTKNPEIDYWDGKTAHEKLQDYPYKISFPAAMGNAYTRWLEDGSYLRLKDLTLGYNINSLVQKLNSKNISIFISMKNLVTITKFSGYNPEVSSFGNNDKTLGTSFYDYPISKEVNLGLNVTF